MATTWPRDSVEPGFKAIYLTPSFWKLVILRVRFVGRRKVQISGDFNTGNASTNGDTFDTDARSAETLNEIHLPVK